MGKKKWTDEQKDIAVARLTLGDSPVAISTDLGIPKGTVRYWKSILPELIEEGGPGGYHSEEVENFTKRAWNIIHEGLRKIEVGLDEIPMTKPYDIKQVATSIGILYDKVIRAIPQTGKPKKARPIDLSNVSTEHLRIIVADIKRTVEVAEARVIEE